MTARQTAPAGLRLPDLPLLGLDAGGTSTVTAVHAGGLLRRERGGPMNALLDPDGVVERIAADVERHGVRAAGAGVAGVRGAYAGAVLAARLTRRSGVPVAVADDAEVARLGAFGGGPGAIVIAGTGTAALGTDAAGRTHRLGGHGYLLDDRGGGYWIGREITRVALHSATGAGERAPAVEDLVFGAFGGGPDTVEAAVHGAPTDRGLLARLAEPAAALDDPRVTAVLDQAVTHLTALAHALRRHLGPVPVAMVGGIWHIPRIRTAFVHHTGAVAPAHPPEIGALILAARAAVPG